jgi:methionyl-tRNA synthetase
VNARPHLGHAYTTIVADCAARFHRAMGHDTFFLTGTDEHGDKIAEAAARVDKSPGEYADEISREFAGLWPEMEITNDDFIRTTQERHVETVRRVLQKVYDAGDIYYGEYGGHYCKGCECFLFEHDLEEGVCPDHQCAPDYIAEKNYFFRMSRYQDWLKSHILENPGFIRPDQYRKEVLALLDSGALEDLCISRPRQRLDWGIELPFDANYVCYVWFDALLNYVSALGYPDGERFRRYWGAANHLVAKDILKPHAVFWPTMLKAAGIEPYRHLNVHGYWLVKETKMSKSLGNVVDPLALSKKYGHSAFRYFLMREMRFGNDASFSEEALIARYNTDLANDLGNLVNRVLGMCAKYFDGRVPEPAFTDPDRLDPVVAQGLEAVANFQDLFASFAFAKALDALWDLVRALNRHIDSSAPWALYKQGRTEELGTVMYTVLELTRKVAANLWCVMPQACETLLSQLGQADGGLDLARETQAWGLLAPGTRLAASSNVFPRLETPEEPDAPRPGKKKKAKDGGPGAEEKTARGGQKKTKNPQEQETAAFEDFARLDLRVGRVAEARLHPDADRLLVLAVDLGEEEPRSIVAGLAEHYAPDDLVGRLVVVVANLKPRKLRGVPSQGMVLAAHGSQGLKLVSPGEAVEPGTRVS